LFVAIVVVDVVAAAIAFGQAVRSHYTVLSVLQQQERRRRRSATATDVAHAGRRAGQDHRSAFVEHRGVRGRRPPTSTATATAAAATATAATTSSLRQRGGRRRGPVRPGVPAPGHHRVRPGIAGPAVDHLRD